MDCPGCDPYVDCGSSAGSCGVYVWDYPIGHFLSCPLTVGPGIWPEDFVASMGGIGGVMDDEVVEVKPDKPKLSHNQVEMLEKQSYKLVGRKLENWTDGKGICGTCSWATIIRQASRNTRVIRCGQLNQTMPEDVAECNSYSSMTELSLSQMASMATLIGGLPERKVGFRKE
jgi:hypothetical protein